VLVTGGAIRSCKPKKPAAGSSASSTRASLDDAQRSRTTACQDPEQIHNGWIAAAAKRHRRSLNNEVIVCLEAGLGHDHLAAEQQLGEIRTLRDSLAQHSFDPAEIDAFKREGRP
jgi:antitoxin FitA